jgi:hypothetical protein
MASRIVIKEWLRCLRKLNFLMLLRDLSILGLLLINETFAQKRVKIFAVVDCR